MRVLVTGVAGFIGYHVAQALLARGLEVVGVDDLNTYYDVRLKRARLARLGGKGFSFHKLDIADHDSVMKLGDGVEVIVHVAAQAGVRYSLEQPFAYAASNLTGHLSILELARHAPGVKHLIYASSSSVYGTGSALPYAESERADKPSSLYAATKRADELMSASYTHLFGLRQTGLRFFTVYGPWGRPDMAYFGFAEAICVGQPVTLYDSGRLKRDFTYIDDIVAGILGVFDNPPDSAAPHRVFNIGNNRAEYVTDLVRLLERALGREAVIETRPKPEADPVETCANVDALHALCGYVPSTRLEEGVPRFVEWYRVWREMRAGL
ncbi:NAD-dependent epimerase/dehydratase family protein [Acidocella sp. KAb 2-4]|uniref:NAD-dependent epimerase/dehydratase family protein n=1 Tax=Acidocella sp. KAb 2-4 TaxID=2885158 RepID=UPI001D0646FC|nr:NAD-dependent epimerase/dehydratase family protein [Acidocella sp. KAb 2-4]MCB5944509.1 NAD-dependent epimerase/dehydratase family protein [Acidocella sp. KAb 2-4]